MTARIVLTLPIPKIRLEEERDRFRPYEVCHQVCQSQAEVDALLNENVQILFTNVVPSNVEPARNLKWVQLTSAGIDHVQHTPIYERPDIVLTAAQGIYSVAVAEYTLGVMLCLARNFSKAIRLQQARRWTPNSERYQEFPSLELHGKQVGIIGYGSVGKQIARLCIAFGMRVIALRRAARQESHELRYVAPMLRNLPEPAVDHVSSFPDGLGNLLAGSDFVIVAAPLTTETRGLIDTNVFQLMKRSAFLINISRGPIIDEAALCNALKQRLIAGAVLDVFNAEPLSPASPLYACPNLMITPHIAGVFSDMFDCGLTLLLENFERYRAGMPLYNTVSRIRGY